MSLLLRLLASPFRLSGSSLRVGGLVLLGCFGVYWVLQGCVGVGCEMMLHRWDGVELWVAVAVGPEGVPLWLCVAAVAAC